MKWLSKSLGIVGLLVLSTAFVSAHCGHCGMGEGKQGKAEKMAQWDEEQLERLTQKLNLTSEQQAQVKPILAEKQERLQQVRRETHEKIKAILTEEQKAKFEEMKAKGPGSKCPMGCDCPMCQGKGNKQNKSNK